MCILRRIIRWFRGDSVSADVIAYAGDVNAVIVQMVFTAAMFAARRRARRRERIARHRHFARYHRTPRR